jgi:hypothetical protein
MGCKHRHFSLSHLPVTDSVKESGLTPEIPCSGLSRTPGAEKAIESSLQKSGRGSIDAIWALLCACLGQLSPVVAERVQGLFALGTLKTA